jgi:hypothetical protein
MNFTVVAYCRIRDNAIIRDGQLLFRSQDDTFQQFSDSAYRHFQIAYPKFHKMDNLSKLGLLTSDILLNNNKICDSFQPERTGIILGNKNSSLDTDVKYFNMVKTGVASPAVFVYSLPNIVIGEICIRNGIKGENTFFISERYDIPAQVTYINQLFETGILDACIGGWMELMGAEYEAFLYLAVKGGQGQLPHSIETIKKIYQHP